MKYYVVVGEESGDLHAANLMREIQSLDSNAIFRFRGGDEMLKVSSNMYSHFSSLAIMGFLNVLLKLGKIKKEMKSCQQDILDFAPDVLILVDYPGFNLQMAKWAKKNGLSVAYYILPKSWAWNEKRWKSLQKYTDLRLSILPFEEEYFKTKGLDVTYVGNPLIHYIHTHQTDSQFREKNQLSDKPIIALLPGSRKQELKFILPELLKLKDKFPTYEFVISGVNSLGQEEYDKYLAEKEGFKLVFAQHYNLLKVASVAVVTSGTATLETGLLKVPQIVVYKSAPLAVFIAKRVAKVKYISLVNLILDKLAVKEMIQEDCRIDKLTQEVKALLENRDRQADIQSDYDQLSEVIGRQNASQEAAKEICDFLQIVSK